VFDPLPRAYLDPQLQAHGQDSRAVIARIVQLMLDHPHEISQQNLARCRWQALLDLPEIPLHQVIVSPRWYVFYDFCHAL
jgi:hypothetical protein